MNGLRTALLLGLLSGILLFVGQMLGGAQGLMIGLILAVGVNFFSYFFAERMALSMYDARPVTPQENPEIYARVYPMMHNLVQQMGIPMPRLWVIADASPNAFATGRNPQHSSVAMTQGLLALMSDRELEGVLAHELGHVKNRDILTSSIAATLAAALTHLAYFAMWFGGGARGDDEEGGPGPLGGILMIILAPLAAGLIQMAISRTREFSADSTSARYTGSPDGLIHALRKLEQGVQRVPMTDVNPATAHMFIFPPILGGLSRMFSTHPSLEARIKNLEAQRFVGVR